MGTPLEKVSMSIDEANFSLTDTTDYSPITVVYNEDRGSFQVAYDETGPAITEAIIVGTAHANNCDPLDLPLLYNVIDPDALISIFSPINRSTRRCNVSVSFEFADCDILVNGNGLIEITPVYD